MKSLLSKLFCIGISLAILQGDNALFSAEWKAGKAKAVITPKEFMWMSGYGSRNRPADGKLTDLWAKVLVLEDQSHRRAVWITIDLIGIGKKMSTNICDQLKQKYQLERSQVAICTSHTHTGPALDDNLMPLHYLVVEKEQQQRIATYSQELRNAIVQLVGKALENLEPVELESGSGRATFAVNRRNNAEAKVPELRKANQLRGPFDHDVPVLAVRTPGGELHSVVFGYACHATVLSFYKWSGDYPGFAQLALEKKYPGCQAMFWAGCGGDQNPLPRRQVKLAEEYGERLAASVIKVLEGNSSPLKSGLLMAYREIQLPLSKLPSTEQIRLDAKSENRFVRARAEFLLQQLKERKSLDKHYSYPVQSWIIGHQIQVVFLGGEVVVDYAVRLKEEGQGRSTWVAAYTNDVMAYIPSKRVLREGGYEGATAMIYYGLPCSWAPEVEEMIVKEVKQQLGK